MREAGSNKIISRFRGDSIRAVNGAHFITEGDGKVGVGNTNPTYQVDVVGTGNFTQDGYFGGDVGIGTSSPATKLHVIGGISGHDITGSSFIQGDAKANEFYAVKVNRSAASNNSVDIWDQNGAGVVIGATASEKTLTVDAGGNVGIGTVSPSTELHLVGDMTFDTSAGRDVLFGDNLSAALEFKEGSNLYMSFVTTNGSELSLNKNTDLNGTFTCAGNLTCNNSISGQAISGTSFHGDHFVSSPHTTLETQMER